VTVSVTPSVEAKQEVEVLLNDRVLPIVPMVPAAPPSPTVQFKTSRGAGSADSARYTAHADPCRRRREPLDHGSGDSDVQRADLHRPMKPPSASSGLDQWRLQTSSISILNCSAFGSCWLDASFVAPALEARPPSSPSRLGDQRRQSGRLNRR